MIGIEALLELASVLQRLKEQSALREGGAASPSVSERKVSRALLDPTGDLPARRMDRSATSQPNCGDSDAGPADRPTAAISDEPDGRG
jgi:hypothetical protein